MKLKIPFDEIKDAIEQASYEHHYLIDKLKHEIIFISEHEEDYEKKLEEVESDDFIGIPERMPDVDFNIMRSFVWKIRDFKLAQKFDEALNRRKPFRNFRELIGQHPELREKWFEHRDKEIANETMNWLCENNIELEDKNFMPKIEIKELTADEVELPEGWGTFGPAACMNCHNKEGLATRYFELNVLSENMLIEKEIKRIMKERYGIKDYGHIGGGEKEILTSPECPKCKSNEIFEDF